MKKLIVLVLGISILNVATAQYMQVENKILTTASGEPMLLRGINSGRAEDGNIDLNDTTQTFAYLNEIGKKGFNAIRFTWYTDGVSWRDGGQYVCISTTPEARYHKGAGTYMKTLLTNGSLGALFDYCKTKNIRVIWTMHNLTCSDDWNYFNTDLKKLVEQTSGS